MYCGYSARERAGDRAHFRARAVERRAGSEPRHDVPVVAASLVGIDVIGRHRPPDVHAGGRKLERRWHDADDRVRGLVQHETTTNDARIGAESPRPELVAQHDDASVPVVVIGDERAA